MHVSYRTYRPYLLTTTLKALLFGVWFLLLSCSNDEPTPEAEKHVVPERIVSLAPSITETLYALGVENRIVAVTSYCRYPREAQQKEKVGGYFAPNLERIISLKPDLVILMQEQKNVQRFLDQHELTFLQVHNATIAGICSSFVSIGRACGVPQRADSLLELFEPFEDTERPPSGAARVLISVGRDGAGSGRITTTFAAGKGTFYGEIIRASGAVNAYSRNTPLYPELSREGIISLRPDVIIDIAPAMASVECSELTPDWRPLMSVPAVKHGAVHCLDKSYATIPGPRLHLLLHDISSIVSRSTNRSVTGE